MLTSRIIFTNFKVKINNFLIKKELTNLLKQNDEVIKSLSLNYPYSFNSKQLKKFKNKKFFRIIGIGGSILGAKAIYYFLKNKVKKNFTFVDNLTPNINHNVKKKYTNIVISKSGNTIETIINCNILLKKKEKNIFITENKINCLNELAKRLKSEVIHHNNFIGGRYSVLSEVGMLPAELMGLKTNKFKQLNSLIKNKIFLNNLISNVSSILYFLKKKKFNSIIINYDEKLENFLKWYQQLVAESLGKKSKGVLPIISNMPKDNHSVMQLYLDGFKNNFYTFFYVKENASEKINNLKLLSKYKFLKNKNLDNIIYAQKTATEKVFNKKKIPFRSFEITNRDEEVLGELFSFFILETILLGRAMKLNPFDQPEVELIKKETKKILF